MRKRTAVLVDLAVGLALVGVVAAVSIPSLLRARVSLPTRETAVPWQAAETLAPAPSRFDTEAYSRIEDNPFLAVETNPLSTFAVDVDRASYANVRRFLNEGRLPPKDAVRIEELINYFPFDYPPPVADAPFSVTTEVADCPWQAGHQLIHVGLQGRRIAAADLPPSNLVFLIDVSGSMDEPMKLPLLKSALSLLVESLRERDHVAIVVYAGEAGLVLESTPGNRKAVIRDAIDRLDAGGSTAGGAGIMLAYRVAAEGFIPGGVNRVLLATDGDFNVGVSSPGDLVRLVEEKRKSGIALSVLGFGSGNLKDATMEQLADKGDGNYSYIDSMHEARKVLVAEAGGTLVTIAKDVKVQVEFNPRRVRAHRLIGYENRLLRSEDFGDDRKDAGEIGSGHSVTALYEVVPAGAEADLPKVDSLAYQEPRLASAASARDELATIKLRFKAPDGDTSKLMAIPVKEPAGVAAGTENVRFAAAVAAFGMLLRGSEHKGDASFEQVLELARASRGEDPGGYRSELIRLVEVAGSLAIAEGRSATLIPR